VDPSSPIPKVIDYRSVEFTPEEQDRIGLRQFQTLNEMEFLVKLATQEGRLHAPLRKMSIASIDAGLYTDSFPTSELRQALSLRYGLPQETILAEIERRSIEGLLPQPSKANTRESKPARLKGKDRSSPQPHDIPSLPVSANPVEPVLSGPKSEPTPKSVEDEDLFQ
jgi:hypothetical protein